jgi:hypothetical protein
MAALRRLYLVAALLGSILGGYVFSAPTAAAHPIRTGPCGGIPWPC